MTQKHKILVSTAVKTSNATNACHKVIASTSVVTHMIIAQNFTTLLKAQLLLNSAFTVVNRYLPRFEKRWYAFPRASPIGAHTWMWPGVAGRTRESKHVY